MSNFNELDFSSENEDEAVSVNSTEPMDKVAKVVVKRKPKKQSPPSESSENEQEAEQPKVPRKKAVVKRKQAKPQEGAGQEQQAQSSAQGQARGRGRPSKASLLDGPAQKGTEQRQEEKVAFDDIAKSLFFLSKLYHLGGQQK